MGNIEEYTEKQINQYDDLYHLISNDKASYVDYKLLYELLTEEHQKMIDDALSEGGFDSIKHFYDALTRKIPIKDGHGIGAVQGTFLGLASGIVMRYYKAKKRIKLKNEIKQEVYDELFERGVLKEKIEVQPKEVEPKEVEPKKEEAQ